MRCARQEGARLWAVWGDLAANGDLPTTFGEANRAEPNVGERRAAAARTRSPEGTQDGRTVGRLLGDVAQNGFLN